MPVLKNWLLGGWYPRDE